MGTPNIFLIFLIPQVVVIGVILIVLKKKLDSNLIDLAITQVEAGRVKLEGGSGVIVTTHNNISEGHRARILKAFTQQLPAAGVPEFRVDGKLLGGMVIKAGSQIVDYSLIDRLRKAK